MGWADPLDAPTLARQLRALSLLFSAQTQTQTQSQAPTPSLMHSDASTATTTATASTTASNNNSDMTLHMASLVPQIYQKLDALADDSQRDAITGLLQGHAWVWVDDGVFVTSDRVALATQVNATPYLYQVPSELRGCHRLIVILGVKAAFGPRDYIEVLRTMADESSHSGNTSVTGAQRQQHPLTDTQVDMTHIPHSAPIYYPLTFLPPISNLTPLATLPPLSLLTTLSPFFLPFSTLPSYPPPPHNNIGGSGGSPGHIAECRGWGEPECSCHFRTR